MLSANLLFLKSDYIIDYIINLPLYFDDVYVTFSYHFFRNIKEKFLAYLTIRGNKGTLCDMFVPRSLISYQLSAAIWGILCIFSRPRHSSEIRGFAKVFVPAICFKICHILYIRKPKVDFCVFYLVLLYFFPLWIPWSMSTMSKK